MNKAAFDALDKPTQEAVLKSGRAAEERGFKAWQEKTKWYHDEIAKKGMKVSPEPGFGRRLQKIGDQLAGDWLRRRARTARL